MVLRGFAIAQVVGTALMALTLYATFRTVAAVVLPLLTVGLSTLLVMGLVELTGQRLTFTNASVPLMMLVIGVAEVAFLVSRFHEEAGQGWDDGVSTRAFASALWPGFIAGCTTSAGFLALGAGHIGLTRDFGFNMSVASLVTFAIAACLIPGALARLGRPPERALRAIGGGTITRFLERTAVSSVLGRHWMIATGTLALMIFGIVGISRITLDQYATRELAADHPVLTAQRLVDTELGGAFQTNAVVRAADGGPLATPEHLRSIETLQTFLAQQPDVVKA
jgi:predicted RND superfamily exporter protein